MRDAGAPPTLPVAGRGDHATAVGLYAAIVTALYRRERTGKGSHVTTSLIAEGAWSCSMSVQAALCGAKFFPLQFDAYEIDGLRASGAIPHAWHMEAVTA
jgi:crotonobetainyl-CoA:carnitine CoA-transferase CaiB-like acyl-CoA transferase